MRGGLKLTVEFIGAEDRWAHQRELAELISSREEELRGGEGTAEWDAAASNRFACFELLDRELFI